jgi:hypothetical protein
MATPERAPLRLHPTIVAAIIAVCIGAIVFMVSFAIPLRLAGQAYLLLIILLAFRYWPPLVRWVKSMPVVHRVVFGLLIGLMILGHYTLNGRTFFPYVTWEIFPFVNETNPVTCREFIATTASGKKVRLLVEQLFPSIVQIGRLEDLDNTDFYPPDTTERLVHAMAKVYNAHHTGDPVQYVDLMLMAVPLHPPANESRAEPSCELLNSYDISSGR